MSLVVASIPQVGEPNSQANPEVSNALTAIITVLNGDVDYANLDGAVKNGLCTLAGQTTPVTVQVADITPTAGPNVTFYAYDEGAITFPSRCVAAWTGGFYATDTNNAAVNPTGVSIVATAPGTDVRKPRVTFQNYNGSSFVIHARLIAIGY